MESGFENDLLNKYPLHKCKRKVYEVMIQRVVEGAEYNVKGQRDIVFNILEQSLEPSTNAAYIITGTLGEMWPINEDDLNSYDIDEPDNIDIYPKKYKTKSQNIVYSYVQIDKEIQFEISLRDGVVLHGNSKGIEHGEGDCIVFTSLIKRDFRIVNGIVFEKTYERIDNV